MLIGERGEGHQGTYIKNPWAKPKEGRIEGGSKGGWGGVSDGGKMETIVLKQQFKKAKKKNQDGGVGRHTAPPHPTERQQFKNKKQPELTENLNCMEVQLPRR